MKAALALVSVLALAAGFALGRHLERRGLASVDSFREGLAARDEIERARRIGAFLHRLGPENLPAAREALEANNRGVTRQEVRLFMLAWSRFDAAGAFAWARDWPTRWKDTLMVEAMHAWGLRDARAGLRELEAMGDDPELEAKLRAALFEGWAASADRAGATAEIAAIPDPRQRRRLAFLLAAESMRDGPDALVRWAESVPEDAPNDFKHGAFYLAATLLAREQPRQAAEWFVAYRASAFSADALEGIARRWAEHHDPPALFEWLLGLPAGEGERAGEIGDAVAAGFRVWMRESPEQAEAWLSSALPDPRLDPAIVELVRARFQSSPDSAVEWALRIEDEAQRSRSAQLAAFAWHRRDPEAARTWLAASGLPEDLVQSILSSAPPAAGERAAARPAARRAPR
jgi:hypothetical protein